MATEREHWMRECKEAEQQITQLKADLAEAEKDGKRLDFITDKTYSLSRITLDRENVNQPGGVYQEIHWDVLEVGACRCMGRGKTPRQAIDKAMEKVK